MKRTARAAKKTIEERTEDQNTTTKKNEKKDGRGGERTADDCLSSVVLECVLQQLKQVGLNMSNHLQHTPALACFCARHGELSRARQYAPSRRTHTHTELYQEVRTRPYLLGRTSFLQRTDTSKKESPKGSNK